MTVDTLTQSKPRIHLSAAWLQIPWACPPANKWVCRSSAEAVHVSRIGYGQTPAAAYAAWSRE